MVAGSVALVLQDEDDMQILESRLCGDLGVKVHEKRMGIHRCDQVMCIREGCMHVRTNGEGFFLSLRATKDGNAANRP